MKPDNYDRGKDDIVLQLRQAEAGYYDRQFIATQARLLHTREMYDRILKQSGTTRPYIQDGKPLPADAGSELFLRDFRVQAIPGTSLLQLHFYHKDPEIAAAVTNNAATAYRDLRMEELQAAIERKLRPLIEEVVRQRKIVSDEAVEMARLRVKNAVEDSDPENAQIAVSKPGLSREEQAPFVIPYVEAKTAYLMSKRILANAEEGLSKARMELMIDSEPTRFIEKAQSPAPIAPWSLRRIWQRISE